MLSYWATTLGFTLFSSPLCWDDCSLLPSLSPAVTNIRQWGLVHMCVLVLTSGVCALCLLGKPSNTDYILSPTYTFPPTFLSKAAHKPWAEKLSPGQGTTTYNQAVSCRGRWRKKASFSLLATRWISLTYKWVSGWHTVARITSVTQNLRHSNSRVPAQKHLEVLQLTEANRGILWTTSLFMPFPFSLLFSLCGLKSAGTWCPR